jgi:phage terminase large subunit-like protein
MEEVKAALRPAREPHQTPPPDPWTTWLFLGGRGAGKTFAGAHWIADQAERHGSLALVGPTFHDVREVMIEGPSGIKSLFRPGDRPTWRPSRRRLEFRNGAVAQAFSAEDPDSLRGPQFHAAWADEFCAWPKPAETLAMLRFGLRLGTDPRLVVTTTPRPIRALRNLIAEPGAVDTRAPTWANEAHLAPAFLSTLHSLYGGTRLAAQELDGLIVESEGGLFRAEDLARCRGAPPAAFDRVVVAVDPPATAGGDACGIVVCGRFDGRAFVLADRTARGLSPNGWARRAVEAAVTWSADALVAEANQGGDMVRSVLAQAGPPCAVKLVKASVGKRARAEPVAALYEQGRVVHCGAFPALEEELMALGSGDLDHSPDRADALVWAVSDLMLGVGRRPRLSVL